MTHRIVCHVSAAFSPCPRLPGTLDCGLEPRWSRVSPWRPQPELPSPRSPSRTRTVRHSEVSRPKDFRRPLRSAAFFSVSTCGDGLWLIGIRSPARAPRSFSPRAKRKLHALFQGHEARRHSKRRLVRSYPSLQPSPAAGSDRCPLSDDSDRTGRRPRGPDRNCARDNSTNSAAWAVSGDRAHRS